MVKVVTWGTIRKTKSMKNRDLQVCEEKHKCCERTISSPLHRIQSAGKHKPWVISSTLVPLWLLTKASFICFCDIFSSSCRAPAGPGARWQRVAHVGPAARLPPQPRHYAGAAASAFPVALPAEAGWPALPGPPALRAPGPGRCRFPTARRPPTASLSWPAQPQSSPVLAGGRPVRGARSRQGASRARLTPAQTPRRGLSEQWGQRVWLNSQPRRPEKDPVAP